jgi:hypothetical protein
MSFERYRVAGAEFSLILLQQSRLSFVSQFIYIVIRCLPRWFGLPYNAQCTLLRGYVISSSGYDLCLSS